MAHCAVPAGYTATTAVKVDALSIEILEPAAGDACGHACGPATTACGDRSGAACGAHFMHFGHEHGAGGEAGSLNLFGALRDYS